VAIDEAHDDGAGLQTRNLVERRRLHLDEHVRGGQDCGGRIGKVGILVRGVRELGGETGTPLDQHAGTGGPELGGNLGHECDPSLIWRSFAQHAYRRRHDGESSRQPG
jgi:hypothetical protein